MNAPVFLDTDHERQDSGLLAVCGIAGYYRVAVDAPFLARDLALKGRPANGGDLVRAAQRVGLKARLIARCSTARLAALPTPAIVGTEDGTFQVFGGRSPSGMHRLIDPLTGADRELSLDELAARIAGPVVLIARRIGGNGVEPRRFGFRWFLPSIWRYRKPLAHVLLASLLVQIFAMVTPLIFQVIVDKVLTQGSHATLVVLTVGLVLIGSFDIVMQHLRTYALSHTTNRIDVELGQRLFGHMLRLPLDYFETRPAGQTVARLRELETIRSFLTGQGLFAAVDLMFAFVFVAVLLAYSVPMTLCVLASIPVYVAIGAIVRPFLREAVEQKFNTGAASQQFLVESVVGIQTVKAAAIEPLMLAEWEERLAAYVRSSFGATLHGALGQNAMQYAGKLSTAAILFFGAQAVISGDLTVGALVAFNMIAGQFLQPVLRLSQLWQDFQQVQISVERLGDILNVPAEPSTRSPVPLPPPSGAIAFRNVSFRYRRGGADVLKDVSIAIRPGEVIGIVGPSGSGKSTLTKLVQRLYGPQEGQVLVDGIDIASIDPAWLRRHIGVVLQDSLLFNRSVHDNIALADPTLSRQQVMHVARLSGAAEFIARLPQGYDTLIEERGANLSGGQRQRIAIARALATEPRILILDEATSALDYESERLIQTNMREMVRGRTVIIIAHRLAAVRPCHRIVGMEHGRVVEVGSHDELLARPDGLYARLWALQNEPARQAA